MIQLRMVAKTRTVCVGYENHGVNDMAAKKKKKAKKAAAKKSKKTANKSTKRLAKKAKKSAKKSVKAAIRAADKDAEAALDRPEGADLRGAEATAAARTRDLM
jgi:hypothetical protein